MSRGLDLMDRKVRETAEQTMNKASIAVSDDRKTLVISHPYFGYLAKIPHFHLLKEDEQAEVLRICRSVDLSKFASQVSYHYDNDKHKENGYTYVIDNLRYILTLPEERNTVLFKFMLICAVGKMKFLSKRNIDLLFVEKSNVLVGETIVIGRGNKKGKPSRSLPQSFQIFWQFSNVDVIYSDNSEELFNMLMTFARWSVSSDSLKNTIMKQEVFGRELEAISAHWRTAPFRAISGFVENFLSLFAHRHKELAHTSPIKAIHNDFAEEFADSTVVDISLYMSFFGLYIDNFLTEKNRRKFGMSRRNFVDYSYSEFKKNHQFKHTEASYERYKSIAKHFDKDVGTSKFKGSYLFYLLLQEDQDKFVELMNATVLGESMRDYFSLIKAFSQEDTIPLSLLCGLYNVEWDG